MFKLIQKYNKYKIETIKQQINKQQNGKNMR